SLRPAARTALLESIAAFESQRAQVRTSEAFAAGWNEGLEQWKALDKSLESGELKSAERSTDLHGKWIDAMLLLSEALIEDFGLTRAPERDSNALVDASFLHTPRAAETLGQMRAFGTAALVEKNLSYGGRAALSAMK